ncbi:MAG: VWA domain-containing protein, partial [Actinomycetota bacterium]|nr:VWA domain-containing protein [Actinomycetota bacterium]
AGGDPADDVDAALRDGDQAALRDLARRAVARYAGMAPGRPMGGSYYLFRTLRALDLDGALARLLAGAGDGAGEAAGSALEERLARDEYEARLARLRHEVESEVRRLLVADRGPEALARTLRRPLPEDVDFMHASTDELAALRGALQPLARKLAVRLARRRRHHRRGGLDFRRTVRRSMSYGGVPAEPRFRRPHPAKPEILVLADISGSVAAFARFTLHLVYAISSEFARVRSFVFIDGVDEVTRFFDGADDIDEAVRRANAEADVVWVDGHSDYGHALEAFWARWGEEIGPRTTVILLGDARNNYHAAHAWVVAAMAGRARHVYWLNPEPRSYWDTGDSILGQYALHCDGTFECRNLTQLARFVEHLG